MEEGLALICRRMEGTGFLRKTLALPRHVDEMKESGPGSWNTEPVLPLFFSLDVSITTISVLLGDFFFSREYNTKLWLILFSLPPTEWNLWSFLHSAFIVLDWDNSSVRNICLLKTTQEHPEHPARPGPHSGQLPLNAFHSRCDFPGKVISQLGRSPGRGVRGPHF